MSVETFSTVVFACIVLFGLGMIVEIGSYFVSDEKIASSGGTIMLVIRLLLMVVPVLVIVIANFMTFK